MVANKSMGFRPWLQPAAASRLVAMLQNSISQVIQSYRSKKSVSIRAHPWPNTIAPVRHPVHAVLPAAAGFRS